MSTTIEEKQELLLSINTEVEEAKVILTKLKDEQEIRKDLEEKQLSCDNIEKRATSLRAEVKMLSDEKLALVEEVEDFQNAEMAKKIIEQSMLDYQAYIAQ